MFIKKVIPNKIRKKLKQKLVRTVYETTKPYEIVVSNHPPMQGKIVVVTGGSGVIGRAISFRLAALGAKVYVSGRSKSTVMKVVDEIRDAGLKAEAFIVDVSDAMSIESAFDSEFGEKNNRLDILVNCAGGGARGKMESLANQDVCVIDDILNTNLRGSVLCTRKAAQYMIPQNKGRIIIISSAVGVQGKANYSEYAAAKSGMFGFMKSMAIELGSHNITVNCVTPGFIQRGEYSDEDKVRLEKTNALHKIGTPEDVASAVAFIASDEAGFITGQSIGVDGGRTLGLMGDWL
jgi:3-oxoacyl-[acyl-carrier protein] reductase